MMYLVAEKGATAILQRSFKLYSTLDQAVQSIIDIHVKYSKMKPCKRWTFNGAGRGFKIFEFSGLGETGKPLKGKALEKSAIYAALPENSYI